MEISGALERGIAAIEARLISSRWFKWMARADVNASVVNSRYAISHKPIEIDLAVGSRSAATLIGHGLTELT